MSKGSCLEHCRLLEEKFPHVLIEFSREVCLAMIEKPRNGELHVLSVEVDSGVCSLYSY